MSAPAAAPLPALRPERRPRRPPAPRAPRRVSGPSRRAAPRPARARVRLPPLALDAISLLERLSRHRLLDRLIRGRAWIGLVAFALIGIVTLQLALLKLNAGVGRALEHGALLQRENAALNIENSELGSSAHVQARAAQLGMEFASSASLRFLGAHNHSDVRHAVAALSAPRASSGAEGGTEQGSSSVAPSSSAGGEAASGSGREAAAPASSEAAGSASAAALSGAGAPAQAGERPASEAPASEAAPAQAAPAQGPAGAGAAGAGTATVSGAAAGGTAQGSAEAASAGGTGASAQG